MKIVMVDYFLPNSIYSLELCEKLAENNEVILICKDNYNVAKKYNFTIRPILHSKSKNKIQGLKLYLNDLKKIMKIIKEFKPNVFHLQEVQHVFFEKKLVKKSKKIVNKTFFTAHNILSHESKKGEKRKLSSWYKVFDGIIVHNEMSREMLHKYSNYKKDIFVIPHGTYDTYKNTKQEKVHEKITFLQFGLIREYKGVDILLEAISLLPKNICESCKFVIAGNLKKSYYDFDIYEKVKKLNIEESVELIIRRIEDDEIPNLFNNVDYCVFPYRHIYGSGALLMAYTYNKPVIVSNIPVFIEETENGSTGLVFESCDSNDLAIKIIDLYNKSQEDIIAYKNNIKNLVDKKYNWTNSAKLTIEAYSK